MEGHPDLHRVPDGTSDTGGPVPGEAPSIFVRGFQFFFVPLLIVAVCVSLYYLASWVVFDHPSVEEMITELRAGGEHARAHAALQLAVELRASQANRETLPSQAVPQIADLMKSVPSGEGTVRQYLAMCLGLIRDRRATEPLLAVLHSDPDVETKAACIDALGAIGDPAAASDLSALLDDASPIVRRYATFNLGVLARRPSAGAPPSLPEAVSALRRKLEDPSVDVQWNAACALALFLSDESGLGMLRRMLDRSYVEGAIAPGGSHNALHSISGSGACNDCQRGGLSGHAMKMAIASVLAVRDRDSLETLRRIGRDDPDFEVRRAAQQAAAELEKKG